MSEPSVAKEIMYWKAGETDQPFKTAVQEDGFWWMYKMGMDDWDEIANASMTPDEVRKAVDDACSV